MYCFEMCFHLSPLPPCLSPLFHPSPFSSFPSLPPPPVVVEEEEEEIFVSSSQIDRKRFFLISVLPPLYLTISVLQLMGKYSRYRLP